MITFFNWFTKLTAWIVQKICFKTKVYYQKKEEQGRHVKGPAIIISNHTSVYDYAVFLFVFFTRTLRYQMAEVLFKKAFLRNFLKALGGIFVDRESTDYSFIDKSQRILERGGVVGIFPEGRIPEGEEEKPAIFKTGAVQLSLMTNAPIIPVYTNGVYFKKERARVIIGKPIFVSDLYDNQKDYKQNLKQISIELRQRVIDLGKDLEEKVQNEREKKNK